MALAATEGSMRRECGSLERAVSNLHKAAIWIVDFEIFNYFFQYLLSLFGTLLLGILIPTVLKLKEERKRVSQRKLKKEASKTRE